MSGLAPEQAHALRLIVLGVLEAVAAAGPAGAPGGVLYAALMTAGCTIGQFDSLMGALVRTGKLRKQGELYFIAL